MVELFGYFVEDAWLIAKAFELGIWAVATFLAVKILPKIPDWFDVWIDKYKKIDFSKKFHAEVDNVIRFVIYIISFYFFFVIIETQDVLGNKYYQLLLLFFLMKISLSILRPAIRKIDDKMDSMDLSEHSHKMIENMISYVVYSIAFVSGLTILGYTSVFTGFIAGAGVLGITIGFAAKDVVSNTLSGIFIAFDKPIKYGEVVEISGNLGIVENIGLRMTKLKTFDNKIIMIPNMLINSQPVINYTRKSTRRIEINVGIAYESDLKTAMKIMKKSPKKIKGAILNNPKKSIQVYMHEFGASSIDLRLRFWINTKKGGLLDAQSVVKRLILTEFSKNNIEIPYPKQVIISEKGQLPITLKKKTKRKSK